MSSFIIKIIAAVTMLIDHMGLILFPQYTVFRIIGRIAYPLYAYCIAEGFRYTHSRTKYFLRIFLLGLACQIVYTVVDRELYIGILLVFSMSIMIMSLVECVKASMRGEESSIAKLAGHVFGREITAEQDKIISLIITCAAVMAVFVLCMYVEVDYGFFGVMLPVFTNLFADRKQRLVMFSACLIALCIDLTGVFTIQYWSLLTIPILATYNGKRGKYSLKYLFYIFYPLHLAVLYGISYII